MNQILFFLDNYYEKALKLSKDFDITRDFDWTPLLILNELSIQIGHIYNVIYKNENVNELERDFNNLGDEISDVFLQLISLSDKLNINLYEIKNIKFIKEDNWFSLPILIGQLNESIMEKYGYRFNKSRIGYTTIDDFIKDRIFKLFQITYQIAQKYNLNIENEFESMLIDANGFLDKFKKAHQGLQKREYIDCYNEKHQFIGIFEKSKAHKLELWHDVAGCLIFNDKTMDVFFQIKNAKHNNTSTDDLFEITVGGHLRTGENEEGIVREIKEETGLKIPFEKLIKVKNRNCNIDNNQIINEFQNYYILPLNINLSDFSPNDIEVKGFVKIKLHDAINVLIHNKTAKVMINIKNQIRNQIISKTDFDRAFINNGVFEFLLNKISEYRSDNDEQ